MEIVETKDGVSLPNLGMAAVSFSAVLTILQISERSQNLKYAIDDFAIGIPMLVGCYFLIGFEKRFPSFHLLVILINLIFIFFGNISCLMGLHKCFYEIYPTAAEKFKIMAYLIFGLNLLLGLVQSFDEFYSKKEDKIKDNQIIPPL